MFGNVQADGSSGGDGQEVRARRKTPQTAAARRARRMVMGCQLSAISYQPESVRLTAESG
jgi:hypothetical protein